MLDRKVLRIAPDTDEVRPILQKLRIHIIEYQTITQIEKPIRAAMPSMEIPQAWADKAFALLKPDLRTILAAFCAKYPTNRSRD